MYSLSDLTETQKNIIVYLCYALIIILLLIILFKKINVKCICSSNKQSKAPFNYIPNPAEMDIGDVSQQQQNIMNKNGCINEIGGIWVGRSDGSGICQVYHGTNVPLV